MGPRLAYDMALTAIVAAPAIGSGQAPRRRRHGRTPDRPQQAERAAPNAPSGASARSRDRRAAPAASSARPIERSDAPLRQQPPQQRRTITAAHDNGRYDNGRYDNGRYNNGRYYYAGATRRASSRPTIVRVVPYRPYVYRPSYYAGVYYGSGGYYPYGYTPRGYYEPIPGRHYGGVRITGAPRDARVFADGYYVGLVNDFDGIFQHMNLEAGPHHIEIEWAATTRSGSTSTSGPARRRRSGRTATDPKSSRRVLPADAAQRCAHRDSPRLPHA